MNKKGKPLGWRKPEGVRERFSIRAYPDEKELITKFAHLIKKGPRAECEKFLEQFP